MMLVGVRSLPVNGDVAGAITRIKTIKVHPLKVTPNWPDLKWLDLTPAPQDTTPVAWENNIEFWRELYEVINSEPPNPQFHYGYGELAALGLEKGRPFNPDTRMTGTLEQAAKTGNAQMRVESFGDRRPDRIVWPDRKWEWAALRYEDGDFKPRTITISTLAINGSIRPSAHRQPCSSVTQRQARSTGSASATTPGLIWTAASRIS
jgi:hypothetical protein